MDFIIDNTSFQDPSLRRFKKASISNLVERFRNNNDPFDFDTSLITTQYTMYRNDSSLGLSHSCVKRTKLNFGVNCMKVMTTKNWLLEQFYCSLHHLHLLFVSVDLAV